jgi:AraC family transcriptional regulator
MHQPENDNLNTVDVLTLSENRLVFSSLREFYHPVRSQGFAIKYVTEGIERYTLNGQKYPVEAGKYLLSNIINEGYVQIESRQNVKGICINLTPTLLTEVVASHQRPDTAFTDPALGQFFCTTQFLDNQYSAQHTQLGHLLMQLAHHTQHEKVAETEIDMAFFYAVAERIITDQKPVFRQLQAIQSLKSATKKDLYRRVLRGKDFIDASFLMPLSIGQVAHEAGMSEYHFFRLFKMVFDQTPNQYIIQKRLERGHLLLCQDRNSVTAAALESGFSDIYSFSKAFKKHFGCSPNTLKT